MVDVTYFMWGYQLHFQVIAQSRAESVFAALDSHLAPRVFLVGFLAAEQDTRHPICVVPDDCPYTPGVFADAVSRAKQRERDDPRQEIRHTHPLAQQDHQERIQQRALSSAVTTAIENCDFSQEWVSFASPPTRVEGFDVLVILQLQREPYAQHYRLRKSSTHGCWTIPFPVHTSLIDAAATAFLDACVEILMLPQPGKEPRVADTKQILQSAAKLMMHGPILAGMTPDALHDQDDICNAISTLTYEAHEGTGTLIYGGTEHPSITRSVTLSQPVSLRDYQAVRKLLETAKGNLALLTNGADVYGLGTVAEDYDEAREDIFTVSFHKRFSWSLSHAGHTLMQVTYSNPALPSPPFQEDVFRANLPRIFPHAVTPDISDRLHSLVSAVSDFNHGALLIVSTAAQAEANRLSGQGTQVDPFLMTNELLASVTSIDGAVLLDLDGVCYGIGIILDGLAHEKCLRSRGARYNSAVRYVYWRNDCMAIVKSEDGMVDILPDLMPLISRSDIEGRLAELRRIADGQAVDRTSFFKLMSWFDRHRFYLLPDVCTAVNNLATQAYSRIDDTELTPVYARFEPYQEMGETYFVEHWS